MRCQGNKSFEKPMTDRQSNAHPFTWTVRYGSKAVSHQLQKQSQRDACTADPTRSAVSGVLTPVEGDIASGCYDQGQS